MIINDLTTREHSISIETHESFIPGQYNDAHEYYIQLINRLIETATME